mmetsp:Transcript_7422/g.20231  ORF Transcript_7422/g.20231 Transcript_7422/m.20231 type:complete len:221 (+) Transcript_7422:1935-2597(+)
MARYRFATWASDIAFPCASSAWIRRTSTVFPTAGKKESVASTTCATSPRVIFPVNLSPCPISSRHGPGWSSSLIMPVGLITEYGRPQLRTAISPSYLWFRMPPGLSCTIGISAFRFSSSFPTSAFLSTPADDMRTICGLGFLNALMPPSNSTRKSPNLWFGFAKPLKLNREYTSPNCFTDVGSSGGPSGTLRARLTGTNSCQGMKTSAQSPDSGTSKVAW